MTQKKLRLVTAKLFAACPVRRGSWYLENGCVVQSTRSPLSRHGRACDQGLRGESRRPSAHARIG